VEAFQTIWSQIESPLLIATPFLFVFVGIEVVLLGVAERHETRRGYSPIDTRISITMGLGALVFFTVFKLATMVLFVFLWTYIAPWHVTTNTWWSWLLLFIVVDLAWYLNHRFSNPGADRMGGASGAPLQRVFQPRHCDAAEVEPVV
jgi:sterol desaturase/sphingolipid hydroxylase (fatty acid hydroxylase superfamily)